MSKGETKKRGRTWWVIWDRLEGSQGKLELYTRSVADWCREHEGITMVEVRLVEVRRKKAGKK